MTRRVALYLRVSTNQQTTDNQRKALETAIAQRGWTIVAIFDEPAMSGAKGRTQRPHLDALLKSAVRGQFDVVAAWSVDRLGRSLPDLVATLGELQAAGVDLFLHQQAVDTTTPSGRALFGMMGVFAEFERELVRERVRAGLARARSVGRTLGRPASVDRDRVRATLASGVSQRAAAKALGISQASVQRASSGA
jgi:DNA invertase Pin-like site-specific DNA recombinase